MGYLIATLCIRAIFDGLSGAFIGVFLKPKKRGLHIAAFALVPTLILVALSFTGLVSIENPSGLRTVITLALYFVLAYLLFEGKWVAKLFYLGLVLVIGVLAEYMTTLPYIALEPGGLGSLEEGFNLYSPVYIKIAVLYTLLFIFMAVIAVILIKRVQKHINNEGLLLFSLFPISQVILMVAYCFATMEDNSNASILTCAALGICCIAADVGVYRAMLQINRKTKLEQISEFYKQQLDTQLEHYKSFSRYDENLSHIRHDLANQTMVIQKLIKDKEYEEAMQLITPIQENVKQLQSISYCQNKIVSALIFSKKQEADDAGIDMEVKLQIPEKISIEPIDLCSIFSNILDNAIAACRQVEGKPYIKIESTVMKGFLIIRSENSMSGEIKFDDDDMPISPYVDEGRGNGNKILQQLADKYNGEMRLDFSEKDKFKGVMNLKV